MSYQIVMHADKVATAKQLLADLDYDGFIGTGTSGALIAPVLAYATKKRVLLVRKSDDKSSHSSYPIVGDIDTFSLPRRLVFVDDFVSSGTTLRNVQEALLRSFIPIHGVQLVAAYEARDNKLTLLPAKMKGPGKAERFGLVGYGVN